MKILLTGANGYIGKRLLPVLAKNGYHVVCCVRDKNRFDPPESLREYVSVVEVDFLSAESMSNIPQDIDGAYYLIHSMSNARNYQELELRSAENFTKAMANTQAKHVVYLSGIVNEQTLSKHLASRKAVEETLAKGSFHLTTLRAGIIIGSGSASFEIIRDLVEKLPVMVAPKWLLTRCQPIGIRDVISFLEKSLFNPKLFDQNFDIGGPDILTYKEMLEGFARVRGLKRWIYTVPVMTPRLSSYWLYFITSTSYRLATALVSSMKVEVVCRPGNINQILGVEPASYKEALQRSFTAIDAHKTVSSWKDSLVSGRFDHNLTEFIKVPEYGCLTDKRSLKVNDTQQTIDKIWNLGGETGWYYGTWLWKLRGLLDKMWGGVGLRRGRTHPDQLSAGDALDFWRVLYANKAEGRLLLFAEMKLPGEAWLEFQLHDGVLFQTATFRPKGIWGRLYWYSVMPFHGFVFSGMLHALAK